MSYPFRHDFLKLPELRRESVDGKRFYLAEDGQKYVSVTTALSEYKKESLDKWKKRVGEQEANRVSRFSTSRGHELHAACENYLKNVQTTEIFSGMMPHAKSLFVQMRQHLDKIDNIKCIESPLFSNELRLAGTVDCIADYEGVLSVIDFKTSRKMKKREYVQNYFLQCTCYAIMLQEMLNIKVENLVLIIGVDETNSSIIFTEPFSDGIRLELTRYIQEYHKKQRDLEVIV